jgi:glutathione S-transferase
MRELSYISVEEAIPLTGLRVAFTRGAPGPWGVAARAIFEYKDIPFIAVAQEMGQANEPLLRWTGQTSAPVAMFNDERPRPSWSEIILLAERLAPERPLIPKNPEQRLEMFGLCHELCAEDGLGWSLRLVMSPVDNLSPPPENAMMRKYDSYLGPEHSRVRANAILGLLARRLAAQKAQGSEFLVGDSLTAADFYWTAFSILLRSFSPQYCDVPDWYRAIAEQISSRVDPAAESLFEFRDMILQRYVRTPMRF